MIATQTLQHESRVDPWLHGKPEGCQPLLAEAERELAAFITAVSDIFGSAAATRAADYWVELAETVTPLAVEGHPNWRKVTIMASCRLAVDSIFRSDAAEDEVGRHHRRSDS